MSIESNGSRLLEVEPQLESEVEASSNEESGDSINHGQAGRPTKYNETTVDRLCEALGDGMSIKSACIIAGICVTTLSEWRKQYPELEQRLTESRELLREKALQTIKKAVYQDDWRAAAKALELIFPADYRAGNKVSATATATASTVVITAERQREIQERMAIALRDIKP
jgi:transposase-like protein